MRRSPRLPIETMAAISFVVVASVVALVVLVRHVDDRDVVRTADRSTLTTVAEDAAPAGDDQTTSTTASTVPDGPPSTEEPASPPATSATTSSTTTSTTQVPNTGSSPPPSWAETPPECPGLVSDTYWTSTGERAPLLTGAGGEAGYTEVVRNESDESCTLTTSRCGTTAELRTAEGEKTDRPPITCPSDLRQEVLEPGEQRIEQLNVLLPVPPGEYRARIRRYDGTAIDLPVQLDDRLPACASDALVLEVGSEQGRSGSEIRSSGVTVDLNVRGGSPSCTVRMATGHLRLDGDGGPIDLTDPTERWVADPHGAAVQTHIVLPPADVPAGEYDGAVSIVLHDGTTLRAPLKLEVW